MRRNATQFLLRLALAVGLVGPGLADTLIDANKYEGTVGFIDLESG